MKIISRFLASLLVEVGEYDISGPNEMMSTKEMKVKVTIMMINDHRQTNEISNYYLPKGETRGGSQGLPGAHL